MVVSILTQASFEYVKHVLNVIIKAPYLSLLLTITLLVFGYGAIFSYKAQ